MTCRAVRAQDGLHDGRPDPVLRGVLDLARASSVTI